MADLVKAQMSFFKIHLALDRYTFMILNPLEGQNENQLLDLTMLYSWNKDYYYYYYNNY